MTAENPAVAPRRYDPLLDEGRRPGKGLSTGTIIAIIVSVLFHVGLIYWLWKSKFQPSLRDFRGHGGEGRSDQAGPTAATPAAAPAAAHRSAHAAADRAPHDAAAADQHGRAACAATPGQGADFGADYAAGAGAAHFRLRRPPRLLHLPFCPRRPSPRRPATTTCSNTIPKTHCGAGKGGSATMNCTVTARGYSDGLPHRRWGRRMVLGRPL